MVNIFVFFAPRHTLAAVPQQPGWSFTDMFYNTNVKGGGDVALAREFEEEVGNRANQT